MAKKNDFVFMDPPYVEDHNYRINYNLQERVTSSFVEELQKECKLLDQRGVKWMMTQADTHLVREAFKHYNIVTFPVFRGYENTHKSELIIKNY